MRTLNAKVEYTFLSALGSIVRVVVPTRNSVSSSLRGSPRSVCEHLLRIPARFRALLTPSHPDTYRDKVLDP